MGIKIDCKDMQNNILEITKNNKLSHVNYKLYILANNDIASNIYIKNKVKICEALGIECIITKDPQVIRDNCNINNDSCNKITSGAIIQLPVDKEIEKMESYSLLQIEMKNGFILDVDATDVHSLHSLMNSNNNIKPCTPSGIYWLLLNIMYDNNDCLKGKNVVIIGKSVIVGKSMALALLNESCTVTVCDSNTKNLESFTRNADIIISATGKKYLITEDMITHNTVLIDVGITRDTDNKIYGDIHPNCYDKSSYYTTVPGGIGLLTTAMVAFNLVYGVNRIETYVNNAF